MVQVNSPIRRALASLCDAVLGPPPWRAPAAIAIAWTQTQCMWTAPCARGELARRVRDPG